MRNVYDIDVMLPRFRHRFRSRQGRLVTLSGIDGMDGYNPSGPVANGSYPYVFVRAEPRDLEFSTWSVPFRQVKADEWEIEEDVPMLPIQDPFVCVTSETLVVGGVRIVSRTKNECRWETVLMCGDSLHNLQEFARSPALMKDVRLVALEDGSTGVFTRPFGGSAAIRYIGYTEVRDIRHLDASVLADAPLLETQPVAGQWWGTNAAYNLGSGLLGVLGHIARLSGPIRHYYAIAFVFDWRRFAIVGGPAIIAERSCFPAHDAKRPDLRDVVFPASIDRERGLLYGGLSDAAIGVLPIDDPFAFPDGSHAAGA